MDKKKILISLGVVAVIGLAFYFYNKNKKSSQLKSDSSDGAIPTQTSENETKKATLDTRKEKKRACGRKPLGKKNREEYQKCIDAGGTASFEGDFDDFQDDYID